MQAQAEAGVGYALLRLDAAVPSTHERRDRRHPPARHSPGQRSMSRIFTSATWSCRPRALRGRKARVARKMACIGRFRLPTRSSETRIRRCGYGGRNGDEGRQQSRADCPAGHPALPASWDTRLTPLAMLDKPAHLSAREGRIEGPCPRPKSHAHDSASEQRTDQTDGEQSVLIAQRQARGQGTQLCRLPGQRLMPLVDVWIVEDVSGSTPA